MDVHQLKFINFFLKQKKCQVVMLPNLSKINKMPSQSECFTLLLKTVVGLWNQSLK